MTTVTGLTADRMLAIEAASVIDGDIVGDNLILTKHDGSQIDAGNVRGPAGPTGPVGTELAVLTARAVGDIGLVNQIRAGRQLTAADFTNMGLSAPAGLWNLSDLSDVSGNGRALSNKGAVTFDVGINGLASTAARFTGVGTKSLYIADTGGGDPFRIRTGTVGCWARTAKRSLQQHIMSKFSAAAGGFAWLMDLNNNVANISVSVDGAAIPSATGTTDIANDRWHHVVFTFDGTSIKLYVNGGLEGQAALFGSIFQTTAPFNIGSRAADSSNVAVNPFYGRIDEAFVSSDVLTPDQIRNLYCARLDHALGALPTRASVNVRRGRRGGVLTVGDFPAAPLSLFNFSGGSLADEGSLTTALTNNGGAVAVAGSDGSAANAMSFAGAQSLNKTDTGLPAGTTSRSYGCWFKSGQSSSVPAFFGWGNGASSAAGAQLGMSSGVIYAQTGGAAGISGPFVADRQWHFAVVVEENAPLDGIKQKLYVDGRLVASSTVLNSIVLGGASRFAIGKYPDNSASNILVGQIDGVFVCNYALTFEQMLALYVKSSQVLAVSPKNSGDHVEAMSTTGLLATFDSLEVTDQVDLEVA